ncbi:hypothetical protein, partial [Stenotrophomonas maltophilia]
MSNKFIHAGFIEPFYLTGYDFKSAPVWVFIAAIFALSAIFVYGSSSSLRNKLLAVGLLVSTNLSYTLFLAY